MPLNETKPTQIWNEFKIYLNSILKLFYNDYYYLLA